MLIVAASNMPLAVLVGALIGLAAICFLVWIVVLFHAIVTKHRLPTAADGLHLDAKPDERACVIVPAHNESSCVGRLIESFKAQDHPGARFVLALDRCTDDTVDIARHTIADDDRFEIIEIDTCPDGWAGKVNAAWTAVQRARAAQDADLFVFTDADCAFHPGCVRACSALLHQRNLDLLSLLSTLETRGWFEWVCQTSATLELVHQYPLLRANRTGRSQRPFANGQFMMFRSAAYRAVGGHEAVHDALLEDIAFARLISKPRYDFQAGLLISGGIVRCRMYDTWAQFRTGWKRIYTESLNRRSTRMRSASWKTRFYGTILPMSSIAAVCVGAWLGNSSSLGTTAWVTGCCGVAAWLVGGAVVTRSGGAPVLSVPLQLVGAWLVGGILAEGARDLASGRPTRWGGREYVLEDRSAP